MRKTAKITSLLLLFTLIILQFSFYTPQYIYRVFVWQGADYDDYKKFKFSEIEKATQPFNFIKGTIEQEKQAKLKFETKNSIDDFENFLAKTKTNSFLVIKNDTLIYEKYVGNNTRETIQTSFSASKSILSLLIGVAIQQQKIKTIDDPITLYLPELEERDERFNDITIAHLLSMKSGIKYTHGVSFPFVNADDAKTYSHPDLRRVALKHTLIEGTPGDTFNYNNYNALLIGLILERAFKQPVTTTLGQNIWSKIGIEYDANWSTDEQHFEKMESGLNARAIDFAKIGRLVLNKGKWNGEQLIDENWVKQSTQPKSGKYEFGNPHKWTYKYFWWSIPEKDKPSDFMAIGNFGQFIYVSPTTNTIIVRNGEEMNDFDDDDWTEIFYAFTKN